MHVSWFVHLWETWLEKMHPGLSTFEKHDYMGASINTVKLLNETQNGQIVE
jgi:hypothetical protein